MKNNPLVSIIVPIYNVEEYVEKCIDSILKQSYRNLEIILVNDGSTDNSRQVINKYTKDSRCIIIDKENGGLSSARNEGIKVANGTYLYFIDSDDYIENTAVELLVNKMNETNADFCCYRIKFYSDEVFKLYGNNFTCNELIGEDIFYDAIVGKNIKTTAWSKFFNHDFIKRNSLSFCEGIINEDYLFTLQCALSAKKVSFLNVPLYNALQRPGSISRNMKTDNLLIYKKIYSLMLEFMNKKGVLESYKPLLDISLGIQLTYTITQAAYRFDNFKNFREFYDFLNIYNYKGKLMHLNMRSLGGIRNYIYRLSLHPMVFYHCIKFLKEFGFKMI